MGFPVIALQGPYVQGIVPLYRSHSTHQARLALSELSLVVPQGPATHRHRGIRQVTACPGCAPGREDRTGKEGVEQEKESCRAPRGTLLHIPVSRLWAASPQASGERHGHFKSDLLVPCFRCVELRGSKVPVRGATTLGLQRAWSACQASPASSAVPETGAGLRSLLHPAKSPTPQWRAHIHPLQHVLCSIQTWIHGPGEGHSHLPAAQCFGQIQVSVRGAMGSSDEEVEGSSSPGQRSCLWLGRSSPCEAGGDMG